MKKIIKLYFIIILIIVIATALLSSLLGKDKSDFESDIPVISAILSVFATISVGILSYAQSMLHNEITVPKIYKASSDKFYQRTFGKARYYNVFFKAKCDKNKAMQQLDCSVFRMVNAPLVDFSVKSITIIKKKILFFTLSKQTIKLFGKPITLSDADESFRLVLFLPSSFIEPSKECRIIAKCTDVCGKKVKIKCSFSVDGDTWLPKQWKIVNKVI